MGSTFRAMPPIDDHDVTNAFASQMPNSSDPHSTSTGGAKAHQFHHHLSSGFPNGANNLFTDSYSQQPYPAHYGANSTAKTTRTGPKGDLGGSQNSSSSSSSFAQRYCVPPVGRNMTSSNTAAASSSKWSRWFSRK